ncbi:MAG: NADH-quinone oxidoreductase subunit NuoN [Rhodobacteraceae bacterium]|nr:MAG: NADH-quinone oxidoreductase subunit NuoN [Paracoccaceae bacterium]
MLIDSLVALSPEIMLSIYSMVVVMVGVFSKTKSMDVSLLWLSCLMFCFISLIIALTEPSDIYAFNGAFKLDGFSQFFKIVILLSSGLILAMSKDYLSRYNLLNFEYSALICLSVVGMMIMVSASNLMAVYLGLELQSLSLYVIAAFRRDSLKSTEAGLKYFVLGALSSGLFLYGASLVYGFTGTTGFEEISGVILDEGLSTGVLFGLIFILGGMAFKVSAVPFHMWTPDVYEGSPTPVTTFFAIVPKLAAIAMLARLLFVPFGNAISEWQQILVFLSISSMLIGSIAAIGQSNIKRLMAYSSISHIGFALIGLTVGSSEGLSAVIIYMFIYVIANFGVFAFILNMQRDGVSVTDISSLSLYSRVNSIRAFCLSLIILSLAGLPPLVGFFGKVFIFKAAINSGFVPLVIVGGLSSVIGAFYYLRMVYLIYFGEVSDRLGGSMPFINQVVLTTSAIAVTLGSINLFGIQGFVSVISTTFLG